MEANKTPLQVYCKNCGAPAGFDIVRQTYRCTSCGELTGIREARDAVYHWRELHKKDMAGSAAGQELEEHACPACGARVVFGAGEASETCDFCGSRLVRKALTEAAQLPEMIIPFFLTPEEAGARMLAWGKAHEKTPEGRGVVSGMDSFRGYYLPYQIVRGPVTAQVRRDGNDRYYTCKGYLEGTAVNTSSQLDNLILNEMEPFDWSAARPFEYGYIAGRSVKLNDASDMEIDRRIREETREDFRPEAEKVMQTSGVEIQVETGDMSAIPALLPVYFIRSGGLTAVMNGQTGRIAVTGERKKKRYPWIIEPAIYTALLTCLMGLWSHWNPEMLFYSALVFACIIFGVMSEGRTSLVRRVIMRSGTAKARRQDGVLQIDEAKYILKNPYDNTPVFYEPNGKGEQVPVRVRFYTPGRWISILINALVTVFLPAILAAFLHWAELEPGQAFLDGFKPLYGAAWYTLAAFIVLLYFVKGVRKDVYDHPILYELLPNGKQRLMGKRRDRRVSVLSMFGIGAVDSDGKRMTVFRLLRSMGGAGIFLAVTMLFLLLGSTMAIIY